MISKRAKEISINCVNPHHLIHFISLRKVLFIINFELNELTKINSSKKVQIFPSLSE